MSVTGQVEWRSLGLATSTEPRVLFEGRLDNHDELERAVGTDRGNGVAALLARGVERLGLAFLERLIGEFALVVVEPAAGRVHLMRDPTGQRPLLFARNAHGVRFGATPGDLGLPLRADLPALASIASGHAIVERVTALAGIRQVRPGEVATIGPGGIDYRRWWQPRAEPEPFDPSRDYAGEYRDLLAQATACRIGSAQVGTHLSGGWDSSAVTATAAALVGADQVTAFTAVPLAPVAGALMRHSNADEGPLAAATADLLHIRHRMLRELSSPFASARRFAADTQTPVFDAFQIGWWHLIRDAARAEGAGALLTAENGNLSLNASGLPMVRWLVEHGRPRDAWREVRALVRGGQVRWRGAAAAALVGRLPPAVMNWGRQHLAGGAQPADASFLRLPFQRISATTRASANPHADRLALMRDSDPGVHRVHAERHWGLVETDPTADRRLVEWSLRLPSEALLHNGVLRPMARAALQGRVADAVLESNLRGLQSADWYQHVSAADCRGVLDEVREQAAVREFLDIAALEQAIARWPSGDWNSAENYGRYRIGVVGALCTGLFIARFSG